MAETSTESHTVLACRFNAHLTFNVLNSIQGCLLEKEYDDAYELVTSYSRILRKMLINGKIATTLAEELENIRDYMQIERIRNSNLEYSIDTGNLPLKLELPKSLLSSIVENAVKHGARKLCSGSWIRVAGHCDPNGRCTLKISNLAPVRPTDTVTDANFTHGQDLLWELIEQYHDQTGRGVDLQIQEKQVSAECVQRDTVITLGPE
jgi:LytS/YehU family sensor histidine kinase